MENYKYPCMKDKNGRFCPLINHNITDSFCENICRGANKYYRKYFSTLSKKLHAFSEDNKSNFTKISEKDDSKKEDFISDLIQRGEIDEKEAMKLAIRSKSSGYLKHIMESTSLFFEGIKKESSIEKYKVEVSNMEMEEKEKYITSLVERGIITESEAITILIKE